MAIKVTVVADSAEEGGRGVVEFDGLDFNPAQLPSAVQHLLMLRGLKEKFADVGAGREDADHAERGHALWVAMVAGGYTLPGNKVTAKPLTVDEVAYGVAAEFTDPGEIRAKWAEMNAAERRLYKRAPKFMIAAGEEMIRRAAGS